MKKILLISSLFITLSLSLKSQNSQKPIKNITTPFICAGGFIIISSMAEVIGTILPAPELYKYHSSITYNTSVSDYNGYQRSVSITKDVALFSSGICLLVGGIRMFKALKNKNVSASAGYSSIKISIKF